MRGVASEAIWVCKAIMGGACVCDVQYCWVDINRALFWLHVIPGLIISSRNRSRPNCSNNTSGRREASLSSPARLWKGGVSCVSGQWRRTCPVSSGTAPQAQATSSSAAGGRFLRLNLNWYALMNARPVIRLSTRIALHGKCSKSMLGHLSECLLRLSGVGQCQSACFERTKSASEERNGGDKSLRTELK